MHIQITYDGRSASSLSSFQEQRGLTFSHRRCFRLVNLIWVLKKVLVKLLAYFDKSQQHIKARTNSIFSAIIGQWTEALH